MLRFSDKNRKFHPVILAVLTHDTFSEFFHILSARRNVNPNLNPNIQRSETQLASFDKTYVLCSRVRGELVELYCTDSTFRFVFFMCSTHALHRRSFHFF
jgi:hypothetical protein